MLRVSLDEQRTVADGAWLARTAGSRRGGRLANRCRVSGDVPIGCGVPLPGYCPVDEPLSGVSKGLERWTMLCGRPSVSSDVQLSLSLGLLPRPSSLPRPSPLAFPFISLALLPHPISHPYSALCPRILLRSAELTRITALLDGHDHLSAHTPRVAAEDIDFLVECPFLGQAGGGGVRLVERYEGLPSEKWPGEGRGTYGWLEVGVVVEVC